MPAEDLITLAEARSALRLRDTDTSRDDDLSLTYIPALTVVAEDVTGPVVRRAFTHVADGGAPAVLLPHPASSVTSVTVDGETLDPTGYTADLAAGVLYCGGPSTPGVFAGGRRSVTVVYQAGVCADTASVPHNIKLAARIILVRTFQADQQGMRQDLAGTPDQDTALTPSGHRVPAMALTYLSAGAGNTLPGFG